MNPKEHLRALVSQRPGWEFDEAAELPQGFCSAVLKGRAEGRQVVFKYHHNEDERQKEAWALAQLRGLDKVPQLIELVEGGPAVMTFMPGALFELPPYPGMDGEFDPATMAVLTETATFLAGLNAHPFQSQSPTSFDHLMQWSLARTREYLEKNPVWFEPPYMRRSLEIWEERLPSILAEKRCLYYDDYNCSNIFVKEGHLCGVVDFGLTREGTASAQLGTLLFSCNRHRPSRAPVFQAYEDRAGAISAEVWENALALFQFQVWQRLACWGGWEARFDSQELAASMQNFEREFLPLLELRMKKGRW